MMDIGASIGYRAKVRDPQVDLDQFADAFDDDDPKLFEYIGEYLGEATLNDIYANLSITAETSRCQWRGESMDYSQAIEAMQFLESKAAVAEPPPVG